MAGVSQNPPFPAPEDQDQKNIIDKLANFVARNGSKFEEMTKEKQRGNPKFAFLFSGDHYHYYRWKVSYEIAQQQTQQHLQSQQQLAQYSTNSQVNLVQQAIVQQSINSAPWQQAQQQAQQQMQVLQQQAQAAAVTVPMFQAPPAEPVQQSTDLDITELENLLHKIMESCTKESISNGKNFIFTNTRTPAHCFQIAQYLLKRALGLRMQFQHKLHIVYLINDILHHCQRKGAQDLQKALEDVVVPVFFCTQLGETTENLQKVTKVLGIWESHNLFEPSLLQELKDTEAAQSKVDAAREQIFGQQGYYAAAAADPYRQYYQQSQTNQPTAQVDQQPPQGREDNSQDKKVEDTPQETHDEVKEQAKDPVKIEVKEEVTEQKSSEEAEKREEAPRQQPYQAAHYQHPPPFPPPYQGDQYFGHAPPPFPPHFPPLPGYMPPDFRQPPPMYGHPPPNFHDDGFHGRPPPPGPFHGPPQQFDYQHQMSEYEQYEGRGPPPSMVNEYNHGRPQDEEGYGMDEYDIPPEAPLPEPIIPTALYYELPAGLMAPLVQLTDVDYAPLDPTALRLPAPQPPSERLLAAVEAFYSPPSHERPRNSEGWEQSGLFEFYKAKLKYIKNRELAEKHKVQEFPPSGSRSRSRSRSPRRSRSRSQSPRQRRSRSRSRSPKRRHHSRSRSRSISPSPRRRRSRSRSKSPRSRSKSRSRSRSKSKSRSISPMFKSNRSPNRSPTPPSFHPTYTSKVPEQRLDENNVGHQMLKKMGWDGAGLGRSQQGIHDPISGGEIRDKFDKFKGVGSDMKDPFEAYRKSKSYSFIGSRIAKSEAKAAARRENAKEAAKREKKE